MKKVLILLSVVCGLALSYCNSTVSGGGDPKKVLSDFFDALKKKDIDAAKKLATEDSKDLLNLVAMGINSNKKGAGDKEFDKAKMEFGNPKIEGDRALISVKEKNSGESMNFTLKKEKGNWKVAFDKATMMSTAVDKANEKGIDVNDNITKAMNELKGANLDSLRQSVAEEMRKMDTLK